MRRVNRMLAVIPHTMKALLYLLLAALTCTTTLATDKVGDRVWSDPNFHLYVVIVAVVIDSDSKLQSFHVAGVADPKTKKRLEVALPDNYVAAVRKKASDGSTSPRLRTANRSRSSPTTTFPL